MKDIESKLQSTYWTYRSSSGYTYAVGLLFSGKITRFSLNRYWLIPGTKHTEIRSQAYDGETDQWFDPEVDGYPKVMEGSSWTDVLKAIKQSELNNPLV